MKRRTRLPSHAARRDLRGRITRAFSSKDRKSSTPKLVAPGVAQWRRCATAGGSHVSSKWWRPEDGRLQAEMDVRYELARRRGFVLYTAFARGGRFRAKQAEPVPRVLRFTAMMSPGIGSSNGPATSQTRSANLWRIEPSCRFSKPGLRRGSRPSEPFTTTLRLCEAV